MGHVSTPRDWNLWLWCWSRLRRLFFDKELGKNTAQFSVYNLELTRWGFCTRQLSKCRRHESHYSPTIHCWGYIMRLFNFPSAVGTDPLFGFILKILSKMIVYTIPTAFYLLFVFHTPQVETYGYDVWSWLRHWFRMHR